jgi:hypothetical protein
MANQEIDDIYDDLDDFNEHARREDFIEIQAKGTTTITREMRACQVAVVCSLLSSSSTIISINAHIITG